MKSIKVMTLSENEKIDALLNIVRATIDLNQAGNYIMDSKYDKGCANLSAVISSIQDILDKIKS